jgi:hypothetical protein
MKIKISFMKIMTAIEEILASIDSILVSAFTDNTPLLVPTSVQSTSYYVAHHNQYHG